MYKTIETGKTRHGWSISAGNGMFPGWVEKPIKKRVKVKKERKTPTGTVWIQRGGIVLYPISVENYLKEQTTEIKKPYTRKK